MVNQGGKKGQFKYNNKNTKNMKKFINILVTFFDLIQVVNLRSSNVNVKVYI